MKIVIKLIEMNWAAKSAHGLLLQKLSFQRRRPQRSDMAHSLKIHRFPDRLVQIGREQAFLVAII
jgi:hypothetical protein